MGLLSYLFRYIDVKVFLDGGVTVWRFIGVYGWVKS